MGQRFSFVALRKSTQSFLLNTNFIPTKIHLLQAAIGCFMQALNKYPDKSPIRTSILMELADNLVMLNLKLEAVAYYEQALETVDDKTRKLMFMKNLVNLLIDCGDYTLFLCCSTCHLNLFNSLLSLSNTLWHPHFFLFNVNKDLISLRQSCN